MYLVSIPAVVRIFDWMHFGDRMRGFSLGVQIDSLSTYVSPTLKTVLHITHREKVWSTIAEEVEEPEGEHSVGACDCSRIPLRPKELFPLVDKAVLLVHAVAVSYVDLVKPGYVADNHTTFVFTRIGASKATVTELEFKA